MAEYLSSVGYFTVLGRKSLADWHFAFLHWIVGAFARELSRAMAQISGHAEYGNLVQSGNVESSLFIKSNIIYFYVNTQSNWYLCRAKGKAKRI